MAIVVIIAFIVISVFFLKLGYGKRTILYSLLSAPFVYFSLNMIDEAITIDEWQYITTFKRLDMMEPGTLLWIKGTWQYRISEIVSGTVCSVARMLNSGISDDRLVMVYKYSHWLFFFCVIVGIAYIWTCILNKGGERYGEDLKGRITAAALLWIVLGNPVSCLMLKVCNYDAGCVYFGTAGISLLVLAEKKCNIKLAGWAALVSVFSCMEKWAGFPYWFICVAGSGALVYRYRRSWIKAIAAEVGGLLLSVLVCFLSLLYIRMLQGSGMIDLNIGSLLFPIYYMVMAAWNLKDSEILPWNLEDLAAYDSVVIWCLLVVLVAVILFSVILEVGKKVYDRVRNTKTFTISSAAMTGILFIGSIVASYILVRGIYPFKEIPEGYYIARASMNGTTYFYNCRTFVGYELCQIFYGFSVVLTGMPTIYLIAAALACCLAVKGAVKRNIDDNSIGSKENDYFLYLSGVMALILPLLYVLAGDPPVPRYFGVSIILIPLLSVYVIYGYLKDLSKITRGFSVLAYGLVILEMVLYIPNYSVFSPLWLYRTKEWKESIRQGEWATGEAMMWGEDIAIAGNKIVDYIGETDDYSKYTLYASYGQIWLKNPGFNIQKLYSGERHLSFTDHDYYVFSKIMIYRDKEPDFLGTVKPTLTVSMNGEIAVWIYRGDVIADYSSWFDQ